ncbi:MAG: hypothetical protein ABI559_02220 [Chloroflexota bacterium]
MARTTTTGSQESVDKFFDAVNEVYDTLLDAVKSSNDRGYRVSRKLIDEVERGQREAIDLTRKFASSPRDISGFYSGAVRSVTDAQGRALELTRQFLDEVTDSGREARDTLKKVIEANRDAGQAAISATRDAVQRTAPAVEQAVNGVRARAAGTARKAAKAVEDNA